jgi:hypothetical protein
MPRQSGIMLRGTSPHTQVNIGDAEWERVTIEEEASGKLRRFGRVKMPSQLRFESIPKTPAAC